MLTIEQIQKTVSDYFKDKPVKRVYLFGSYARGDANENSDVDLLVELDDSKKKVSLFELLKLNTDLEEKLNRNVQLIEEAFVYNRFLPFIQKDKIKIYEA
ncbi:MAG: nucleotidyltransferase domain-containing protein [Chitinophagaceae bacterium]|jgi:predicted nucleotidyltransferase|nr:MAG: nucleotidyltransferase domain-containing protein [Chitinophagaceae bacterium]